MTHRSNSSKMSRKADPRSSSSSSSRDSSTKDHVVVQVLSRRQQLGKLRDQQELMSSVRELDAVQVRNFLQKCGIEVSTDRAPKQLLNTTAFALCI